MTGRRDQHQDTLSQNPDSAFTSPLQLQPPLPLSLGPYTNTGKSATTNNTFTFFPLLPPEIRQQIWAETLPKHGRRVLHFTVDKGGYNSLASFYPFDPNDDYVVTPQSIGRVKQQPTSQYQLPRDGFSQGNKELPAALAVNMESRTEVLKHLVFWNDVWCDLEMDIIYFEAPQEPDLTFLVSNAAARGLLNDVRHLAVEWRGTVDGKGSLGNILTTCRTLPDLKTLTFVYAKEIPHHVNSQRIPSLEDVISPGVPWIMGPLTAEACLDTEKGVKKMQKSMTKKIQQELKNEKKQVKQGCVELVVECGAIHQRERVEAEVSEWQWINDVQRGQDWFG